MKAPNNALVRRALMAILPAFGWTICSDHIAHWNIVDGKISKTLYPFGWRFARTGHEQPKSQLEQFVERL